MIGGTPIVGGEVRTTITQETVMSIINSPCLKVKIYPKLLISQSKFSGPRKFTLRYQQFEITGDEIEIMVGIVSKLYALIYEIPCDISV